ncbi:MAG TPA: DUF1127 domain-containing protein [Devosia sp.]|nr:DUF1127 domain-containing protein [Devosia sp.]
MFDRLKARFGSWRAYRDTVRELSAQSDWILRDAGIPRGDIKRRAALGRGYKGK